MSDLNFYNQSFTKEMAARNRCCLYERLPVSLPNGRTVFNGLVLSPGHTLAGEEVGADQVADLTQNLLDGRNLQNLLFKGSDRIMVQSVPSQEWLLYRNHIPEKNLIIRIPDSYVLKKGEDKIMLGMRNAGAQFAAKMGKMGSLPQTPELMKCLDYILIEHEERSGLMTAYKGLKIKYPNLECIGVKNSGADFSPEEAKNYDMVFGMVTPEPIAYGDNRRPLWQHELMRTAAELFSGIYNARDIIKLGSKYSELGAAIKGLMSSQKLMELSQKRSQTPGGGRYSQNDILNIMCMSIGFALVCEAERVRLGDSIPDDDFMPSEDMLAYFRQAVIAAYMVQNLSKAVCDDYESSHAFMVGFMLYLPQLLHDTPEKCFAEFMLSAIVSFYGDTFSTLTMVVGAYRAMKGRESEEILKYAERIGLSLSKEDYYRDYFDAMIFADEVVKSVVAA